MKLTLLLCSLILGAAVARKGFGPGEQEWGFSEVRPGAHMFWWMYYTTAEVATPEERPLVIWLQGGPGASSTGFGNFEELGPLDSDLNPRETTWVKDVNVIFIDNPVGTGFSWVEDESLLTTTNAQIADDLVTLMRDFYKQFPSFESTPLYITSESYGGKMAAEFALRLDEEIKKGTINSNLKGVALGDSWISPIDSVMTWAPYLLNLGVVDTDGFDKINKAALACKKAVDDGDWERATNLWSSTEFVIMAETDGVDFYDVMKKIPSAFHPWKGVVKPGPSSRASLDDIMNFQVKEALGLPSSAFWTDSSGIVFNTLSGDFMKPVTDVVETLLNTTNVRVAVFSGQKDLIVDTPGTWKWVDALRFKGRSDWDRRPRLSLVANGYIEGYAKYTDKFGMFWVNRAGHMVPADNPAGMKAVLLIFTDEFSAK